MQIINKYFSLPEFSIIHLRFIFISKRTFKTCLHWWFDALNIIHINLSHIDIHDAQSRRGFHLNVEINQFHSMETFLEKDFKLSYKFLRYLSRQYRAHSVRKSSIICWHWETAKGKTFFNKLCAERKVYIPRNEVHKKLLPKLIIIEFFMNSNSIRRYLSLNSGNAFQFYSLFIKYEIKSMIEEKNFWFSSKCIEQDKKVEIPISKNLERGLNDELIS